MNSRVAILVDGNTISANFAAEIWDIGARHGAVGSVRAYGDSACNSGWQDAIGYRMIHAATGQNAADELLSVDAMALAMSKKFGAVVIAGSDTVFSQLAQRIRELGVKVIGVNETKVSQFYRAVCSEFVQIGSKVAGVKERKSTRTFEGVTKFDAKNRRDIAAYCEKRRETRIDDFLANVAGAHDNRRHRSGNIMVRLS